MQLNQLFNLYGSKKKRIRVGRGIGSGKGKTCGRGGKGQTARSGVSIKSEGGQMSILKRLPKSGFNCSRAVRYSVINIADLEVLVEQGRVSSEVVIEKSTLVSAGIIKNVEVPVKLLGGVDSTDYKLKVKFDAYSSTARSIIEAAGGQVVL